MQDLPPESLVVLDEAVARRMVAAWPQVHATPGGGMALTLAWAAASGVPLPAAIRLGTSLRSLQICRSDGTIAPNAAKYMAAVALKGARNGK